MFLELYKLIFFASFYSIMRVIVSVNVFLFCAICITHGYYIGNANNNYGQTSGKINYSYEKGVKDSIINCYNVVIIIVSIFYCIH